MSNYDFSSRSVQWPSKSNVSNWGTNNIFDVSQQFRYGRLDSCHILDRCWLRCRCPGIPCPERLRRRPPWRRKARALPCKFCPLAWGLLWQLNASRTFLKNGFTIIQHSDRKKRHVRWFSPKILGHLDVMIIWERVKLFDCDPDYFIGSNVPLVCRDVLCKSWGTLSPGQDCYFRAQTSTFQSCSREFANSIFLKCWRLRPKMATLSRRKCTSTFTQSVPAY